MVVAAGCGADVFSLVLIKRRAGCLLGLMLSQGLALEFEAVGVVDDSDEDGVGEGGIVPRVLPKGE